MTAKRKVQTEDTAEELFPRRIRKPREELAVEHEISPWRDFREVMTDIHQLWWTPNGGVPFGKNVDDLKEGESLSITLWFQFYRRDGQGSLIRNLKLDLGVPWLTAEFPQRPFYVPRQVYPVKFTFTATSEAINSLLSCEVKSKKGRRYNVVFWSEGVRLAFSGKTSLFFWKPESGMPRKATEAEVIADPEHWANIKG